MKAKLVEAGKLVEQIPEILVNGEPVAYRGGQTLPIDKDWGTVGEIYEQDKDYTLRKQINLNGEWAYCTDKTFLLSYYEKRIIAVPIASEEERTFSLSEMIEAYNAGEASGDYDRKRKERNGLRYHFFKTKFNIDLQRRK